MNVQQTETRPGPFTEAIRNPGNPDHLMVIKPIGHRVRVYDGEVLISDTTNALRIIEVGKSVYNPTVYVPTGDVAEKLEIGTRTTHCPLKGDAAYGSHRGREIGWIYTTFDFADRLSDHMGFTVPTVRIVEGE